MFPDEEEVEARRSEDGGFVVVYGPYGGKIFGFWETDTVGGAVFGGCGRCNSMNLVDVGVRKHEICEDAK